VVLLLQGICTLRKTKNVQSVILLYIKSIKHRSTAKFGYLLVKKPALKKFDLQDNKEAKKFRIIKKKSFTVK